MKKLTMLAISVLMGSGAIAQNLPQPSPTGTLTQEVGLTLVEVEYSRPGVKDRTIFGELVAYDQMWRTGANRATKVSFSTDVKINGKELKAGDYSLFTIPGKDNWEVMFNTNLELSGTSGYQDSEEALRVSVPAKSHSFTETFTIGVNNIKNDAASLCLRWEETEVCVEMTVDVDDMADENIEAKIEEIENAYGVYHSAARWYLDRNKDPKQALEWAKKSTEIRPLFFNLHTLALAEAANENYKAAIEAAERSKAAAQEAGYDSYVKTNDKKIAEWKKLM